MSPMNSDWMASLLLWSSSRPEVRDETISSLIINAAPPGAPARQTLTTFTAIDRAERSIRDQRSAVAAAVTTTATAVTKLRAKGTRVIDAKTRQQARELLQSVTGQAALDDSIIDMVLKAAGAAAIKQETRDEVVAKTAVLLREQRAQDNKQGRAEARRLLAPLADNGEVPAELVTVVLTAATASEDDAGRDTAADAGRRASGGAAVEEPASASKRARRSAGGTQRRAGSDAGDTAAPGEGKADVAGVGEEPATPSADAN